MKKYAVIGDPIKHSKSPVMHNAGFKELDLNAEYVAEHVKIDDLEAFVARARDEFAGFNVTVPHKYQIIPFLDKISEASEIAGSVNTVINKKGKLIGHTTDGYGLEQGIKEAFDRDIKKSTICFIGCGGAVQAVASHFASCGVKRMFFINRTVSKAEDLIDRIRKFYDIEMACCAPTEDDMIEEFLKLSHVLVQGTSLGLNADDPAPINLDLLPTKKLSVYDTIYKKTKLVKQAKKNGLKVADGRTMLLHQGAKAFEKWTGKEAPIEIMREALYEAMK